MADILTQLNLEEKLNAATVAAFEAEQQLANL